MPQLQMPTIAAASGAIAAIAARRRNRCELRQKSPASSHVSVGSKTGSDGRSGSGDRVIMRTPVDCVSTACEFLLLGAKRKTAKDARQLRSERRYRVESSPA